MLFTRSRKARSLPLEFDFLEERALLHAAPSGPANLLAETPLGFEVNRGQADPAALFIAQGQGYTVALSRDGSVTTSQVRLQLLGTNPDPHAVASDELPGLTHYLRGDDPAQWITDVVSYSRVAFDDVYAGIDLSYHGDGGQLEYDFVVAAGADPGAIRFRLDGATSLSLDDSGDLRATTPAGTVTHHAPVIYQVIDGSRVAIAGRYVLEGPDQVVHFEVGDYDRTQTLVIDPIVSQDVIGQNDWGGGIFVDGQRNVFVTGADNAGGFVVKMDHEGKREYRAVLESAGYGVVANLEGEAYVTGPRFVTKLSEDGSSRLFTTSLEGDGWAITLDDEENVFVSGDTGTGPFAARLSKDGDVVGLADLPRDFMNFSDIVVDEDGNPYVLYHREPEGEDLNPDAYIAKLNPANLAVVRETTIPNAHLWGLAIGPKGDLYATGMRIVQTGTWLPDDPPTEPQDPVPTYGPLVILAKVSPNGTVVFTNELEAGRGKDVAVDRAGGVFVTGALVTQSEQGVEVTERAFLACYSAAGNLQSTKETLGGSPSRGWGIAADPHCGAFAVGQIGADSGGTAFVARAENTDTETDDDGDALPNAWEICGYTAKDEAGEDVFVDLPAMGADPHHKDIFVEVADMPLRRPYPDAMIRVLKAFEDAPVDNPDGVEGIRLHIDLGPDFPMSPGPDHQYGSDDDKPWGEFSRSDDVPYEQYMAVDGPPIYFVEGAFRGLSDFSNFFLYRREYFYQAQGENGIPQVRKPAFHYVLFADMYAAGREGELGFTPPGNTSSFLTMGKAKSKPGGTLLEQAVNFMHELGHQLGLDHGGPEGIPPIKYKPNYLSVMNYSFSEQGLIKNGLEGTLDYSRQELAPLNEHSLDETQGIGAPAGYGTYFFVNGDVGAFVGGNEDVRKRVNDATGRIDWDADGDHGVETLVQANLAGSAEFEELPGADDWKHLRYDGGGVIGGLNVATPAPEPTLVVGLDWSVAYQFRGRTQIILIAPDGVTVRPDATTSFELRVFNHGTESDTFALTVEAGAEWLDSGTLPGSVTVGPDETVIVQVKVLAPQGRQAGAGGELTLSATSRSAPLIMDVGITRVTVVEPPLSDTTPPARSVQPVPAGAEMPAQHEPGKKERPLLVTVTGGRLRVVRLPARQSGLIRGRTFRDTDGNGVIDSAVIAPGKWRRVRWQIFRLAASLRERAEAFSGD